MTGFIRRFAIASASFFAGGILLLSLPVGAYSLLDFMFELAIVALFVPGFAIYIFFVCVPIGLYHFAKKAGDRDSHALRLPPTILFVVGSIAAILLGQLMLEIRAYPIFWGLYIAAASLPPLAAFAAAVQRLRWETTWRHAAAGVLSGSFLSTNLTILLSAGVTTLVLLLVIPAREAVDSILASKSLEDLFYSPALVLSFVLIAIVAPLVEELTKPLGAILLARRLKSPAEAFLVGMAGGVGFAILENMLYEAAGARAWAGIASLRAMGGVLHPLNAGLVAIGWYGVRNGLPGAWRRLFGLYGIAFLTHALWNGGIVILLSGIGAYLFGADAWKVSIYGLGQPGILLVYLILESIALWRLLFVVTGRLRQTDPAGDILGLRLDEPRRLAVWATGLAAVIVSIGALYGPLVERYAGRLTPFR